jgi:uncharacterized protein YaiL (DUF2058 family)
MVLDPARSIRTTLTHHQTNTTTQTKQKQLNSDEQLDEARADLADVKELFRAQLEALVARLPAGAAAE